MQIVIKNKAHPNIFTINITVNGQYFTYHLNMPYRPNVFAIITTIQGQYFMYHPTD